MSERILADCKLPGLKGQVYRAYAALSTADHRGNRSSSELAETLIRNPNKQEKIVAALNLLGKVLPEAQKSFCNRVTNLGELPVSEVDPSFILGNGENIIFVKRNHNSLNPDWVTKVNKIVIGNDLGSLYESVKAASNEYQTIKGWFKDTDLIIPEEHTIIGHSHIRQPCSLFYGSRKNKTYNIPTMITLQRFIPGTFEGIFDNHTIDSLVVRLKNTSLFEQWGKIAETIINVYDQEGITPDIVGANNFSINDSGNNKYSLLHIDPHMIQSQELVRSWNLENVYRNRINFLRQSVEVFK